MSNQQINTTQMPENAIHVNQIVFEEKDEWSKAMNEAGELMSKAMDDNIPEAEQRQYWNAYIELRQRIEMGEFQKPLDK